jgi:hypothetical protein
MRREFAQVSLAIAAFVTLTGCVSTSAVDDFAKASTKAASLFPAVANIPFEACVAKSENRQLAAVTKFDRNFSFDQSKIDCKDAKLTSKRLEDTYAVLATYVSALDKLAGGNVPTFDKNISVVASNIPGLNSTQQDAVKGLAGLVADMIEKGYRQREASQVIEKAQGPVQTLSGMLKEQLPPFLKLYISNERDSIESLYRGMEIFKVSGCVEGTTCFQHMSPTLVTKSFLDARKQTESMEQAVAAFEKIFGTVGDAHTALYQSRNKLLDKGVVQELFQSALDMEKQISAVTSAFKPTSTTTND